MGQKSAVVLFVASVIFLQAAVVTSLSCYKYYKTSIKPEDLPKESGVNKLNCTSPDDACEVRVTRVKASKQILAVDLKCNTKKNCEGAGTGCNGARTKDHDYCGFCCQTDYCNKPEIAKFEKTENQANTCRSNGLLSMLVFLATFYKALC